MRSYHLYCMRLPVGDYEIAYIGVTKYIKGRSTSHRYGRGLLGRAIRQCGHENVIIQKLATGDRRYIFELERRAISRFGTLWPRGYNRQTGYYVQAAQMPAPAISPSTFIKVGRLLYGSSWRYKMASALSIAEATLYRWKRGARDIPNLTQGKLVGLCEQRAAELVKMAQELRQ